MEEVLAGHADVAECAVVGVADPLKGEIPIGFVVLKAGVTRAHEAVVAEVVERVRTTIGPVAAFKLALVVKGLPKHHDREKFSAGRSRKSPTASRTRCWRRLKTSAVLADIGDRLKTIGYPATGPRGVRHPSDPYLTPK